MFISQTKIANNNRILHQEQNCEGGREQMQGGEREREKHLEWPSESKISAVLISPKCAM